MRTCEFPVFFLADRFLMAIEIRRVTDPEELQAIYRFRYDIYVTEMNRVQSYADHQTRTIIDPLDATAFDFSTPLLRPSKFARS